MLIDNDKLGHIYDLHASDFGLSGKKNLNQLQRLNGAIQSRLNDAETHLVRGHYRGRDANLFYNPTTGNVVVTDQSDQVVAGFKASPAQARYIGSTGRLN